MPNSDGGLREWVWIVVDSLRDAVRLNENPEAQIGLLDAYEPHLAAMAHAARQTQGRARALRSTEQFHRVMLSANLTVETALLGLLMEATGKTSGELLSQVLADIEQVHPRDWSVGA